MALLTCLANLKIGWFNISGLRINVKTFMLIYVWLILCCFLVFRNYIGTKNIFDEQNINSSRFVKDYVFPEKLTTLAFVESPCSSTPIPLILIIVCSDVGNESLRQAIRETWASDAKYYNIHVIFLLGLSQEKSLNIQVIEESLKHKDLIIENFIDSYYNLTVKSIMLLKWVQNSCKSARYVMKIDDDVYLNIKNLFKMVAVSDESKNVLIGKLYTNERPHRDKSSKWYIPTHIYPNNWYPHFLCGVGYLMSGDVALQLYEASFKQGLIFLEDVFITGICAESIGLKRKDHLGFHFFEHAVNVECNSIHAHMVLLSHHLNSKQMHRIHGDISKCIM